MHIYHFDIHSIADPGHTSSRSPYHNIKQMGRIRHKRNHHARRGKWGNFIALPLRDRIANNLSF